MTVWPRIILHADMDAFYAAVEQLDNPQLRGKPVLIGGRTRRGVVSTASYEARPFGVGSAMPMFKALQLCPQAIVVPPNIKRYKEVSGKIMNVFKDHSPLVEPLSLDEAFIDMTGAQKLFGTPRQMAKKVKDGVLKATGGLTISVGVACTKFVAKVASDYQKPDGLTVVEPDGVQEFLDPLSIKRIWGVGPKLRGKLEELGLKTIGDVARADKEYLVKRFGILGDRISCLANGEDVREVHTHRERKSVSAEHTLEENIAGFESVSKKIRQSAKRVGRDLRAKGLVAGGVRVKLKTSSFRTITRQMRLTAPTDADEVLRKSGEDLLEQFDLNQAFRLVGLGGFDLIERDSVGRQGELFVDKEKENQSKLDHTIDALQARFGEDSVRRGGGKEIKKI
jgi:DNA polymerase IV